MAVSFILFYSTVQHVLYSYTIAYAESDSQLEVRSQQYDDLLEWSAAYETASISAKKVIVARMIERVDVYRGYQLKLTLNISVEQFLVSLENIKTPEQSFTA